MIPRVWVLVLALGASAPVPMSSESPATRAEARRLFDLNDRFEAKVEEVGTERRRGAMIHDMRGSEGTPARMWKAYVVQPAQGKGPFPGVLYVHWLGDAPTTNRTEFLDEAVGLAQHGAVSLLIDAQWATPGWFEGLEREGDRARSIAQVRSLRRAIDLLVRSGADESRLAVVGHDFGAMYGVLAGAADGRPKTYVVMAAVPELSDWFLLGKQPAAKDEYLSQMRPFAPGRFVGALAPASVFFQFASHDKYVSDAQAKAFFGAAREPKLMRSYESNHAMLGNRDGVTDRYRWLAKELGLSK